MIRQMQAANQAGDYEYGYGDSSRKRRDDGSPGYGSNYTPGPETGYKEIEEHYTSGGATGGMPDMGQLGELFGQEYIQVLLNMKLEESIGSPLIMAGLGMGCLLIVIILTMVEFYLNRKYGVVEAKYQKVALI